MHGARKQKNAQQERYYEAKEHHPFADTSHL
jgi:hypothetical protein